jgi:hypothetical protein
MAEQKRREKAASGCATMQVERGKQNKWEKPTLDDVSGRVMAQPYIRFT